MRNLLIFGRDDVEKSNRGMKAYFVLATAATWASLEIEELSLVALALLLLGPIWNFVDSLGGAIVGYHTLREAKTEDMGKDAEYAKAKARVAMANIIWCGLVMPAASAWIMLEVIKQLTLTQDPASLFKAENLNDQGSDILTIAAVVSGLTFAMAMYWAMAQAAVELRYADDSEERKKQGLDTTAWFFAGTGSGLLAVSVYEADLVFVGAALISVAASLKALQLGIESWESTQGNDKEGPEDAAEPTDTSFRNHVRFNVAMWMCLSLGIGTAASSLDTVGAHFTPEDDILALLGGLLAVFGAAGLVVQQLYCKDDHAKAIPNTP